MSKSRWLLILWLGLSVCAGVVLWQGQPEGLLRWLLLAISAPPAYLLLSAAAEFLGFAYSRLPGIRHVNEFVEQRTKQQPISGLRVVWYLVSTLVFVALMTAAAWGARVFFA